MTAFEVYEKMMNDLHIEFYNSHTKEEIDFLKNHYSNLFYNGFKNKYHYDLTVYKNSRIIDYLINFYENNEVSNKEKNNMLELISSSKYKYCVFYDKRSIVPESFDDMDLIYKMMQNQDSHMVSYIFYSLRDNIDKTRSLIKSFDYSLYSSWSKKNVLFFYNKFDNEKGPIYDILFDDMCFRDRSWCVIEQYLKDSATVLTSNNVLTLLRFIDKNGLYDVRGYDKYNRLDIVKSIVKDKNILFIPNNNVKCDGEVLNLDVFDNIKSESDIKKILIKDNN